MHLLILKILYFSWMCVSCFFLKEKEGEYLQCGEVPGELAPAQPRAPCCPQPSTTDVLQRLLGRMSSAEMCHLKTLGSRKVETHFTLLKSVGLGLTAWFGKLRFG